MLAFLSKNLGPVLIVGFLVLLSAFVVYSNFTALKSENVALEAKVSKVTGEKTVLEKDVKKVSDLNRKLTVTQGLVKKASKAKSEEINVLRRASAQRQIELSKRTERFKNLRARIKNIALEKPSALAKAINNKNKKLFERAAKATSLT